MQHQVSTFAPVAVRGIIQVLDFEAIKLKLQDKKHGLGWSREKADRVEKMYRRFLFLKVTTSGTIIVPTKDIDEFWHAHIEDTMRYGPDCERAFGFFLHHFPYFGLRGGEDAKRLEEAFTATAALYENTYGEAYATDPNASISRVTTVVDASDMGAGCG